MKKILIYFDSMHTKGGIERVISNLLNSLVDYYNITLLTCDDTNSSYDISDKITFISMNKSRFLDMEKSKLHRIFTIIKSMYSNIRYLKNIVDEYDYIYVATPLTALETYLLGKKYRSRIVVSEHASYYAGNIVYQTIRKHIYPKMYVISVPTTTDTELYKKNKCNAIYIPHMCPYKAVKNKKCNNRIALNVGRMTQDKQQLLLLRMWNNLNKRNLLNGWKLRIVGNGELRTFLEKYILDNNLNSSVTLVDVTNNITEEYERADIFLFASKLEGFGMVLLEAMAYGIPSISFDCHSGPRDILENEYNGYLIECYDLIEYEKRMKELFLNEDTINRLSKGCLEKINRWDNDDIIQKWKKEIFK